MIQSMFEAGYRKAMSERPPYSSSDAGMAFTSGLWCAENNIPAQEIKKSRGYKWIVNRKYILDFKNDDYKPTVTLL